MTTAAPRPRRILFVEANEDGTVGGSYQALYDLAVHLDRTRYEPVVMFYEDNRFVPALRAAGVETHLFETVRSYENRVNESGSIPERALKMLRAVVSRRRALADLRIDLLHLNNSPRVGCDDWLPAAKWHGCPCLVTAMGDAGRDEAAFRRWLTGRFDRVIAISQHIASRLVECDIPEELIRVIHLGTNIKEFRARATTPPELTRQRLGLRPDDFFVLMPGNIKDWKGQHVLVEAVIALPESIRARTQVRFAGATPSYAAGYRAELDRRIAEAGLADRLVFLGERRDIPDLMLAADAIVHASTFPEPFGLVVVEAMALGKPIVASELGGPAEIVSEGSGLLFHPARPAELAAHLARLAEDGGFRAAIGRAAEERAQGFDISNNANATAAVYDEVLGG
ncbi:MAG: glycosyltransferase family 4 protein [Gemmatimonadales bacterium]|nr:glycosyltransferase family 4 protein [Gemmatimonadales bacterium]